MKKNLRVLLVEDCEEDALLLLRELRQGGYDPVSTRVDTAAALAAALDGQVWDLIISDYQMPQFNALSALRLIQERGLDVPFILVSGAVGEEVAVTAMKMGAHDYLLERNLTRLVPAVERELRDAGERHERKRAEARLSGSEERLSLALTSSGMASFDWDIVRNRRVWDENVHLLLGIKPGTFTGTEEEFFRLIHPEDRNTVQRALAEAIKTNDYETEYRAVLPDGTIRHIAARGKVHRDKLGRAIRLAGLCWDITERKRAEAALRSSELRFRRFYESELIGVIFWNMGGGITEANDKFLQMLGYSRGELTAGRMDWQSMTPPEYRHLDEASVKELKATGVNKLPFEKEYIRKDGSRLPVIIAGAMLDEARCEGVAFVLDITERKQIEDKIRKLNVELEQRVIKRTSELQAALDKLNEEVAQRERLETEILEISEREQHRIGQDLHDGLGQELTGISMLSQVLEARLRSESNPLAEEGGKIAAHLRGAIKSTSQLARGLYPVELKRYGLLIALEDLANQTKGRFGISCEVRAQGKKLQVAKSAGIHIYRIVQECIANAIKHGKARRIMIESLAGNGTHTFTVTDDGIGFERPANGPGIGLHLMDYRARLIGAKIDVQKPAEGGCRVTCLLAGRKGIRSPRAKLRKGLPPAAKHPPGMDRKLKTKS